MKRQDFEALLKRLQADELEISQTKGKEYAREDNEYDDVLDNFKRAGNFVGVSSMMACLVYLYKHFSAVAAYAQNGDALSEEGIAGRIADLRLYAALFLALAEDESAQMPEL